MMAPVVGSGSWPAWIARVSKRMAEKLTGSEAEMFANRLRKNARHYFRWAKSRKLTAFRVYDRDIPELPFVVEWYDGRVHLVEYPRRKALREGSLDAQRQAVMDAVTQVLEVPPSRIFTKTHLPHAWG